MYPGTYVARFPDKAAVVVAGTGETLTYADLDERSRRLARVWYDFGLRPGDHVAVLAENTPRVFEAYWAALRSGLYVTPVNRHLSASEVAYIVNDCEARSLVVSAALAPVAIAVAGETPAVGLRLAFGGEVPGHDDYEATLAGASGEPLPSQPRGAEMLYSSGTTGRPKGVEAPPSGYQIHERYDGLTSLLKPLYNFDTDAVYLSPAPIYHAAPLKFSAAVHALGGTVVLMERFDAEAALAAIERYRVTHSQWVPTMFVRMLKLDEAVRRRYDLSSLRVAIHAAAPCPIEVKRAMIEWWGPIIYEYYAATEVIGITFIDSTQWLARPGSVGRAGLGTLRICNEGGEVLPAGQIGTVYFERDAPSFAYHNDLAKTAEARHPGHPSWGTTWDTGYLDHEGYLFLTGRKDFMIISGGVNIYPQEIENSLALHPGVLDVAVIGVPDDEMGESVLAVVQPAPGVAATEELAAELREFLRARIAHYKVPRRFDFTDDLPRTPTGKMVKGKLRARYLDDPARPVGEQSSVS
jgi:fatty-acyl-CoA synthase